MAQPTAYGDIFLAGTPSLDRTSALLYQEQRQRQAKAAQDNAMADAQLQKEFANVRAKDIPDVIDSWNKYKTLKKQLYFDKTLQQDPKKYAQIQQQANEALADTHSTINGSKEYKDILKGINQAHSTHPDNFVDNYGELISEAQNTPLKQLRASKLGDLSNMDTFMYKGPDQDFSKIFTAAAGQPKPTGYTENIPIDKNGLQYNQSTYEFGNTPQQYAQTVLGSLGAHKASKAASFLWNHVPQDERDKVNQAFAAIPADKWKKAGIPAPQDLPTNTGNDAVDFANFQAKQYFLANEPKAKVQVHTNEAKKFQMETDRQMRMKAIEHANAKDLIDYRKSIDPNDKEMNNLWIDKYIQSAKDQANSTPPVEYKYKDGRKIYEHDIPMDPTLANSLQKAGVTPTFLRITSDGKFRPIYIKTDKDGNLLGENGKYLVDETLSQPITEEQLGVTLGKKNVTGKPRATEINSILNKGPKVTKPKNDPLGLF